MTGELAKADMVTPAGEEFDWADLPEREKSWVAWAIQIPFMPTMGGAGPGGRVGGGNKEKKGIG